MYSAGIWDLLLLTATFSSNHPDAYWRALKSREGGRCNLDGGEDANYLWGTRAPTI